MSAMGWGLEGWLRRGEWGKRGGAYPSNDFDVGGARAVTRRYGVDDAVYVALHHAHKVEVVLALGHVAEVFDKVHDVGSVVHGILPCVSLDVDL